MMRKTVCNWAGVLLLGWSAAALADGVAARVNGVEIPDQRLQSSFESFVTQQNSSVAALERQGQAKAVKKQVLDILIDQELLWQAARDRKLVASDEEVDSALKKARARYPEEAAYNAKLAAAGFTQASFAEDTRKRLSVARLMREDLQRRGTVGDEDVHRFYSENQDKFITPEKIQARHILIKVDQGADEATRKAAREKIESVLAEARKDGADFAALAKAHSEGPSGPRGGDLGSFARGSMVKPFEDAAFALETGALSDVVETRFGYHIIKVESREPGKTLTEDELRERIRTFLATEKAKQAVTDLLKQLREAGTVEVLATL